MDDRLRAKVDRNRREIARQRTLRWTCRWTILVGSLVAGGAFFLGGREGALGKIAAAALCVAIPLVLIAGVALFFLGGFLPNSHVAQANLTDRERRSASD